MAPGAAEGRGLRPGWLFGATAIVLSLGLMALLIPSASADHTTGGTGTNASLVGHVDTGDLNGHVTVLGDIAFVGEGTNGGFASQFNKTPTCKEETFTTVPTVDVVDLSTPASPTVVSEIPAPNSKTVIRDVAALQVSSTDTTFSGGLLAVALESCNNQAAGLVGVNFYDVSNPANPVLKGRDVRAFGHAAMRDVALFEKANGQVLALEASQGSAGGIFLMDVTNPSRPSELASLPQGTFGPIADPIQECRPFNFAQGVSFNADGTRAYVAYQDAGLIRLDISTPTSPLPIIDRTQYGEEEEGNSFQFQPNTGETTAVATDEDLLPPDTNLTITQGSPQNFTEPGSDDPGVFRGCEAIWGAGSPDTGPLYRRTDTSLNDRKIVAPTDIKGCSTDAYSGVDTIGNIALTERGGVLGDQSICGFEDKARFAEQVGAVAVLISNTSLDHHEEGQGGFLFSPDSVSPVDAGITIPVVQITKEAGDKIREGINAGETVKGTLADTAETWGALRVFDVGGTSPSQVSTFTTPNTTSLPNNEELFHAVNVDWVGQKVLTAFMSDGLRVVDLSTPSTPTEVASFIPDAVSDPTGNYPTVPLVVGVKHLSGDNVVITDINGGLFVVNVPGLTP